MALAATIGNIMMEHRIGTITVSGGTAIKENNFYAEKQNFCR
jgi:hypothetical protein